MCSRSPLFHRSSSVVKLWDTAVNHGTCFPLHRHKLVPEKLRACDISKQSGVHIASQISTINRRSPRPIIKSHFKKQIALQPHSGLPSNKSCQWKLHYNEEIITSRQKRHQSVRTLVHGWRFLLNAVITFSSNVLRFYTLWFDIDFSAFLMETDGNGLLRPQPHIYYLSSTGFFNHPLFKSLFCREPGLRHGYFL